MSPKKGEPKTGPSSKRDSAPEKQRLAAKAGVGQGGGFEGVEKIAKTEIDGEEVILIDFKFGISRYKENTEYVTCLIELNGEKRQVSLGGQVVVLALKNIKKDSDLPAPVIFLKKKTQDGNRDFWTME